MLSFHILHCRGQHQFDSVQLVHVTGSRIIIHRYDIRICILPAQFLDDALPHHMVRQAAKGLGADNVSYA